MSAYDDEILSEPSLQAYWKAEELSGTVATDSSGNEEHGTIFDNAILGQPGPIETDGTSFGAKSRFMQHETVSGSGLDTRGNFTWEIWGRVDDLVQDYGWLSRNGSLGLNGSNLLGVNSGHITGRVSVASGGANTFNVTDPTAMITGPYYYAALVRNDNVLTLQVNDQEVDSLNVFPSGDIVYANFNDGKWLMGAFRNSTSGGGTTNNSQGVSHGAIYNAALTFARRLAHYEAALNQLRLSGYSNVISSAILYSDVEPAPISFPFRHNWSDPLIERIAFATGISTARKGYEQANAQRIKPRREIELSQLLRDDYERRMFRAKLNAHQHRKWFIPILEDRERLTASLSAGATAIPTDTQFKNYEVGGWVGVRELNGAGRITTWEEALITALTNTEITIPSPGLVNSYTRPEVYPVVRGIVPDRQSLRGHISSVEDTTILARIVAEDEKITPRRITAWTPTITYESYEVFDPATWRSNDWTEQREYEVDRNRSETDFALGSFGVDADSIAAGELFTYRTTLETRQKQSEFLGWFYTRAGSLNYLWVPTIQQDFEIVSALSSSLTVAGHNYFENFSGSEFRRDLAFVYHDNTMTLRRIESVVLDGTNEVLGLDASVPTLTNLRSVSYLLFCQLGDDTLEIAKVTDTKARFAWRFREILSSPA